MGDARHVSPDRIPALRHLFSAHRLGPAQNQTMAVVIPDSEDLRSQFSSYYINLVPQSPYTWDSAADTTDHGSNCLLYSSSDREFGCGKSAKTDNNKSPWQAQDLLYVFKLWRISENGVDSLSLPKPKSAIYTGTWSRSPLSFQPLTSSRPLQCPPFR